MSTVFLYIFFIFFFHYSLSIIHSVMYNYSFLSFQKSTRHNFHLFHNIFIHVFFFTLFTILLFIQLCIISIYSFFHFLHSIIHSHNIFFSSIFHSYSFTAYIIHSYYSHTVCITFFIFYRSFFQHIPAHFSTSFSPIFFILFITFL